MHKDISGVLTVSTCLLNHDRNSVSDFTQTSPPHPSPQSHMCPLLSVVSSRLWQYHWHPKRKKEELCIFRDVSELKVRVAVWLAQPPACFSFALWILAIHILKLIIHISCFFFSPHHKTWEMGMEHLSSFSQTVKKSGGHVFFFFFLF